MNDVPAAALAPVPPRERILCLDILRGMALFGILAANMPDFEGPLDGPDHTTIVQSIADIFIEGKFISLFSFLFGIGFAIQMSRSESRGARFLSFYPRRLLSLALFGLIHGIAIWSGDILLNYAILGALLLLFRNQSQKALLYWAGSITAANLVCLTYQRAASAAGFYGAVADADAPGSAFAYAHRTIVQLLSDNWHSWLNRLEGQGTTLSLLTLFLLGLWIWRTGAVQHIEDYRHILKRVFAVCLPLGLALNTVSAFVYPTTATMDWFANVFCGVFAPPILSAAYASGLALFIQRDGWRRFLKPFAAVGRMALTDYLMQSVVCTIFFYLTGLYGKLGPAWDLVAAAVLYSLQAVFSNWWLARHRYGPMEWLWRSMTYGRYPSPNLIP